MGPLIEIKGNLNSKNYISNFRAVRDILEEISKEEVFYAGQCSLSQVETCRRMVWFQEEEETAMAPTIPRPQFHRENIGYIVKKSRREEKSTSIVIRTSRKPAKRIGKIPYSNST